MTLPAPIDPSFQDSSNNAATIDDKIPMHFIANGGVPGTVKLGDTLLGKSCGIILVDELEKCLEPLPSDIDNEKCAGTRRRRKWTFHKYGASLVPVPNGTTLVTTQNLNIYKKNSDIIEKLTDLFDGERSAFHRNSQLMMTVGGLMNYGGSDEALETIIAMTLKGLFYHIGFAVDHGNLAKGVISRRTIGRGELRFATDCLAKVLYEIVYLDEAMEVCIITDHGHRNGQDHFVVVISWAGMDGKCRTFKHFCPSIDQAGHSAEEAVEGVKIVIERLLGECGIEVTSATSDSGGGAAIQNMEKVLRRTGILVEDGNVNNCVNHGLVKGLQNGAEITMGKQGLGKRAPSQLLYTWACLERGIKRLGGIKFLDRVWLIVADRLESNPTWEEHARRTMALPWQEMLDVQFGQTEMDEMTAATFDCKAPRDMQDPVWTRWQSVSISLCCKVFLIGLRYLHANIAPDIISCHPLSSFHLYI